MSDFLPSSHADPAVSLGMIGTLTAIAGTIAGAFSGAAALIWRTAARTTKVEGRLDQVEEKQEAVDDLRKDVSTLRLSADAYGALSKRFAESEIRLTRQIQDSRDQMRENHAQLLKLISEQGVRIDNLMLRHASGP